MYVCTYGKGNALHGFLLLSPRTKETKPGKMFMVCIRMAEKRGGELKRSSICVCVFVFVKI